MVSKKRNSDVVEEAEGVVETAENIESDNVVASPLKKKMKKGKKKDGDMAAEDSSIKPMERKKKRKAVDKERHHATVEYKESKPKQTDVAVEREGTRTSAVFSSGNCMPEFHISVFQDLASANVSLRQAAAESLVTQLVEVQKAYERGGRELVEDGMKLEADKYDGLNDCAPSLRYAVRRLIRGVSSSRECARQGFALGLTLLIGKIHSVKVDSLLKLIVDLLEVSSSMKGLEARDCLLGHLFAYGAIARSARLTKEWNSDKNTPYIREFTSLLISLAAKRRYLQEPAMSIILDLTERLPTEALLSHVLEAPGLHEWFEGANEVGNPDALLLALRIQERISVDSGKFGKLLPTPFSSSKLFAADHLSLLANCLKESTFCQPRVHGVWPVLVNVLLPDTVLQAGDATSVSSSLKKHKKSRKTSASEEEVAKNLQSFCEVVVEGSLLLSSHDRKNLAFDVLALLFPRLPASFVSIVLSYKLVQCLIDILPSKDAWLYDVAKDFLKKLLDWVGNDDVRRVAVIVALQKHSNGKFDSFTRTKTVKDLMAEFRTESGYSLFIQNLVNMFVDEGPTSEEPSDQSQTTDDNSEIGSIGEKDSVGTLANSDFPKSWVIESLPSILKYLNLDLEAKFRVQMEVLKFLAVQGLFSAALGTEVTSFELQEKFRWPKAATSGALCRMCIEQLQLLLANAQKVENSRSFPNGLEPNDLGSYFMRFLSTLCNIPSVSLFRSLSEDDEKALKKLQEMETKLYREERNCGLSVNANKLHALRYLLIQLLLQVLLRPGEYSEAASELVMCCKNGRLIGEVFKYFCNDVTDNGLLRMLRVIKRDLKLSRHHNANSEDDDDDFLGIEEEEEIDEAETGETGESDEQMDDLEAVADVEEGDKELPEDSDSGVDDEAMFRMDTYLAQIFKEKKNQAGSETAQSQLNLFKLRVLSLLEIYLHENPGKPQVLTVYSNLAQAFVNSHTAECSGQLEQRIWGILQKKIFKAKDFPKTESVPLSTFESLLERNLKLAAKPFKKKKSAANLSKKKQSASWNRYKMIISLAQNSTFWILKIIDARKFSDSELQKVYDILCTVLAGYFDSKKSQIKSEFLKEIFRRRPWIGHHLFSFILEKCGSAKSGFRQVEALDLVMEILKSMVPLSSDEASRDTSKKAMKSHLGNLSRLIKELATHMPEKQSRKSEVRKFCSKIFQMVSSVNLTKSFLKYLTPDAHAACESELGEAFLNLKKIE
ncbi:uncharacterized protein LOC123215113 isoform X2 [Mangifera indica]|uniref:uncharacterized protein LOC123215113 isoform X2 n=1 Tax=Mangifera indica TaxID=29780 RepID=UPI001CFB0E1D|nr:uncharacterized protein LOC123215113 isoform X2 [Mangifera indica]